jgi:hypothetical protein
LYFVDDQDAVYANTEETTLITKKDKGKRKKKGEKKTEKPKDGTENTEETTYGNVGSRTVVSGNTCSRVKGVILYVRFQRTCFRNSVTVNSYM